MKIEHARARRPGVTTLMSVGKPPPSADYSARGLGGSILDSLQFGLMALGASVLLGVETGTARWVGVAAAGGRLAWEGLK